MLRASKVKCLVIGCMAVVFLLTGCETKEEREAREARELAEQARESYYQAKEDYDDLMRTLDGIEKQAERLK